MAFSMTSLKMHLPTCRLQQRSSATRPSTAPAAFAPMTSLNSGLRRPLQNGAWIAAVATGWECIREQDSIQQTSEYVGSNAASVARCQMFPDNDRYFCVTAGSADCGMLHCPTNGATVFAMRHRKGVPKLNRPADQRKALLRSLTTEILRHGKITTTKVGCSWFAHETCEQWSAAQTRRCC